MFDSIGKGKYWDRPWGLVSSCTRCSPGCERCWALAREKRFHQGVEGKIIIHPERLDIPLRRKKPTVFSLWNDLHHESVPISFISTAYEYMADCPRHIFLVLTKRADRVAHYWTMPAHRGRMVPENVWLGVTVCNQDEVWKIGELLKIPAAVRFLSIEPMLGPINLRRIISGNVPINSLRKDGLLLPGRKLDWVILGTESGPNRRPAKIEWMIDVLGQCEAAGVPVFVKQIEIKGRTSNNSEEWPKELRHREIPNGKIA